MGEWSERKLREKGESWVHGISIKVDSKEYGQAVSLALQIAFDAFADTFDWWGDNNPRGTDTPRNEKRTQNNQS